MVARLWGCVRTDDTSVLSSVTLGTEVCLGGMPVEWYTGRRLWPSVHVGKHLSSECNAPSPPTDGVGASPLMVKGGGCCVIASRALSDAMLGDVCTAAFTAVTAVCTEETVA